ncbi:AsmA family protein [Lichenibacterium ramalinae]|uniref:AsmA family protein n=1 Tax=Lichenibacterium ramalinae TaxID=2316527 RepID=A0A4Q2REG2_9HYPH|nr:AsmA-like C-terminal region-containing protein [Lichenibacterium ramalinae]RYB06309.1 AsmA family protein [Lichenibacterium ramalinae]
MTRLVWPTAALLIAAGLVAAATPWRIPRAVVAEALDSGFTGVRATLAGPATIKLLPRPRIQATQLTVAADNGAVTLDAPLIKAELDIPSLLRGRWRMTSATLVEPTATVDLDRLPRPPPGAGAPAPAPGPALQLRLRSGLLRTRSAAAGGDMLVTGIDATATWPGDGDGLVLSGTATARGTTARFAGELQHPARGLTAEGSAVTLQVESPLVGFNADGILSGGAQPQFAGHAALTTTSLPRLLRTLGGIPLAVDARRAQIGGDVVAKPHDVSVSNAVVKLDQARFEGTLAWRRDAGRSLVAGTLATDLLDVDRLFGEGIDRAAFDDLYRRPLTASPFGTDVDMRVSATAARVDRVTVADAAVAALVRGDRLELTLDEAQAYGGVVKARVLATLSPEGVDAHADLTAQRLDLAGVSEALSGRERVGGALSGHAVLDGHGESLHAVVGQLFGSGQVEIEGGRLAGLSLARALKRLGRRLPLDEDRGATPTTFDKAQWDLSIRDGVIRIPDGKLTAPGVAMSFGAETTLPDGRIDVHAVAAQTDRRGLPLPDGQSMPFDMRGSWAGPLVLVGHGGSLPALTLPMFDGLSAER